MTRVWDTPLPDSDKIVLLALADCANDEGGAWPSMATLVKKCSKSDRTIQASIKRLVEAGHLTRIERPGKGCNYTVHPRSDFTPEAASPPKRTTPTPEAASDKPSRTIIPQKATPSSVARATGARAGQLGIIPDWVPAEQWAGFVQHRRSIRKPLTERAAQLTISELSKLNDAGWPPGDMLDLAVRKGWHTVYAPKDQPNVASRQQTSRYAAGQFRDPVLADIAAMAAGQQLGRR